MPTWETITQFLGEKKSLVFPTYDDPPQLKGDYVVCADLHCPFYRHDWVDRMVSEAKAQGIKKLISIGDVSNQDYASKYVNLVPSPSFAAEKSELTLLSEFLLGHFDRWDIIPGNHDLRLIKRMYDVLEQPLTWEDIAKILFPGATFYPIPYSYAILNEQTLLTHPETNYSQIQGRRAQRLANEVFHMNTISAGGHLYGQGVDKSGKYWFLDLPGLVDARHVPYKSLRTTLHPAWVNGFAIVKNINGKDYLQVFADLITPP